MLRDDVIFAVEGERYRWRDVVLAAVQWNDWSAMEHRAREGSATVSHASAVEATLPSEALEEAGREFRYERDLLTAQSMEEWLALWGITVKDWTGYLSRELHHARYAREVEQLVARYPLPDDVATELALVEAICSGALEKWKRTLAAKAAVHAAASASGPSAGGTPAGSRPPLSSALMPILGGDQEAVRESTERLDRIDESFNRYRATQLTERALLDYVGTRQLDWLRFDCRVMAFPDEGMAAEAALLLTEDNEGFTSVYSAAHAEPRAANFFLDQMDATVRDRFLSARAGDLVGPLRMNDEFALYLVMEKILPDVNDPKVRQRAEDGVLKLLLDRLVSSRVRWSKATT